MPKYFSCREIIVYKNPTKYEIVRSTINNNREIRFVVDIENRDVYIWNAYIGKLHKDIVKLIDLQIEKDKFIKAYAYYKNGRLNIINIDKKDLEFLCNNCNWLEMYRFKLE